jgi:hypothetical protein
MDQQKKWLGLYFNSQNQRFENPLVNDTQDNSYSSTIAPSETYKNYIFVNEYPYSNPSAKAGHRQGQDNPWAPDDDNLTNSQVPRTIDDISNIRFPSTANNYSYEIESRPVINQELPDLKRVVPGDIVFYTGHIMIVNKIDIDGDRSDIQMEDIHLIEATFGSTWGKVCNHRTLQERHTNDKDWVIWRLRNNE